MHDHRPVATCCADDSSAVGKESPRPGVGALLRTDVKFVTSALLVSLALHCIHLWCLRATPTFDVPIIDSSEYLRAARRLLDPGVRSLQPYFHSPFYEWFLAAVLHLTGQSVLAVRLIQIGVNLWTTVLIYALGDRIAGRPGGRWAMGLWVLYAPILYFATEIINVPLILLFNVLGTYLALRALERPTYRRWGLAGLVFGLSFLTRPDVLPFAVLLGIGGALQHGWRRRGIRPLLLYAVILTALPTLVGLRNWQVSGHFLITPRNGGMNFYLGNNPDYRNTIGIRPGTDWAQIESLPLREGWDSGADPGNQQYFYRKGLQFVLETPSRWLACLVYKLRTLVNGYELPESFDLYTFRASSPVLAVLLWPTEYAYFPWALLFPTALAGLWLNRNRLRSWWWLWGMGLAYQVSLLGYWNSSRYRMSLVPVVLLLAAYTATRMVRMARRRQWQALAGSVAVLMIIGGVTNIPYEHFSKNHCFDAEMLAFSGRVVAEDGKGDTEALQEGIRRTRQALKLQPNYVHAAFNLGWFYVLAGRKAEAEHAYTAVLQLDPSHEPTLTNLGILMAETRREDESIHYFTRAVQADPFAVLANCNLGLQLDRTKRSEQALPHLEFCAEHSSKVSEARNNLAIALHKLGRLAEAEVQYRASLNATRRQPSVLVNLGILLVNQGRLPEAKEYFQQSLDIDPGNAKARTYLEMLRPGAEE